MRELADEIIRHVSSAQRELANILESERHIAVRMAQIVHALPAGLREPGAMAPWIEHAETVAKSVCAYLGGLADLQEQSAEQLKLIMKELDGGEEE